MIILLYIIYKRSRAAAAGRRRPAASGAGRASPFDKPLFAISYNINYNIIWYERCRGCLPAHT